MMSRSHQPHGSGILRVKPLCSQIQARPGLTYVRAASRALAVETNGTVIKATANPERLTHSQRLMEAPDQPLQTF